MRIATHPEAIKHLVKIGMAADISEHIKMVESANESLINEKDELRSVAEDNKRECEATRIENARLKAEVERLEKEVWRMKVFKGIDEDTKATLKDALNTVPEWAKVLEVEAENARLKAEVERLTAFTTRTIIPNEELKAENARLKAKVSDLECDAETRYRQSMDDEYEIEWLNKITHGLMKEKEQLQAQVDRLTKAGDAMAEEIALAKRQDEGSRFDPIEMHYDHELIVKWNAAKEGKQP